ncbi:MAG TPA: YihY/virulence factor BrkB family protein [Armatimonadota bacterium]|nr:YihY/virulence factor BrkB family protein [Armatimonadota bacterium]HOP79025.1 YihY/virulence factor BrkB family protein [Armatimonadota bacterium]HPP74704.1 YihY/virulence factor BrkB family protein [Armatimonadota bacterium]
MRIPRWLKPAADFTKQLSNEFSTDNSSLVAAAISYYVFLSMIPILLLAIAVFGFVLGSEQAAIDRLIRYLSQNMPVLADGGAGSVEPLVRDIVEGSSAAAGFGIIALLWAGSQAFVNLEKAVNIAWDSQPRGFFKQRLIAIGLLIAVGLLLLISFGITTAANAIQSYEIILVGQNLSKAFGTVWRFISILLPLIVNIATFTLIYKLLPNTRVPLLAAAVGGLVAGLLWELAKQGFSWYITNFANYSAVYGSLATIILLLLWIYYTAIVLILCAQISAIYYRRYIKPQLEGQS